MACNKILSYSKLSNVYNFSHKYVKNNSQPFLKLIIKKDPYFKTHQYIACCHYSTIFTNQRSSHRKSNLYASIKFTSPVSFMSTNLDESQYHIVVTNPQSTTDLSSSVSQLTDQTSSAIANGSSAATDLSSVAASLSTDLQTATQFIEPSFTSLGLANWTPVGLCQMLLEYLHISWEMPWWGAIVASTIVARVLLLPILIKTQKNTLNISNYMPQLQYLQAKFGEARKSGNPMEASRYALEITQYMKKYNISPVKSALLPLCQAPVFISFFLGLRAMAKAPVESMQWGGLSWTTDLTVPDPYYILPVMSCATLYIVLKIGAESGVKFENMKLSKYILQALPVLALPFCINFPSAVLYYWVTTNFCTLAFVGVLKIQPVRDFFKLPTPKPIDPKFIMPKKGFVGGVKEAIEDQKVLASIEDRRRIDDMRFQKAGTGPVPRTYSYDPTKPRPSNAAVSAKQRKT